MNRTEAKDDLLGHFLTGWNLIPSPVPPVAYDDNKAPPTADEWARVSTIFGNLDQQTFAGTGNRRFNRSGILTVQVFTSFARTTDKSGRADIIVQRVIDTFEGERTAGGIWFRGVTDSDVGKDGAWWQTNVTVRFEYQQIK
jgi:hypothetical protein